MQELDDLIEDLKAYWGIDNVVSPVKRALMLSLTQGVWATTLYRFNKFAHRKKLKMLYIPLMFAQKAMEVATGISLLPSTNIGPGLYIGHFGGIIIHHNAAIGKRLNIGQGVTIGELGKGHGGVPVIGDDVYIGVGASVLGNITVGNNAVIGAGAVVLKDVQKGETVVGVPARPIHRGKCKVVELKL